jgi:hypothetical protein
MAVESPEKEEESDLWRVMSHRTYSSYGRRNVALMLA